jgi:hypothetical protein
VVAESWEDKAELIREEAFPKPLKGVVTGVYTLSNSIKSPLDTILSTTSTAVDPIPY